MTQPKRGSLREPQSSVLSTRKHSVVLFEIYHNFCPPMQGLCLRARHRVKGVRKRYIATNWWNFPAIVQRDCNCPPGTINGGAQINEHAPPGPVYGLEAEPKHPKTYAARRRGHIDGEYFLRRVSSSASGWHRCRFFSPLPQSWLCDLSSAPWS